MRYVVLAAVLTAGCGGSAFEAGAAHESDAAPLDASPERDAGVSEAPMEASTESATSSQGVAFCATYEGLVDGGPPAVYGCGNGWQQFIDAGLTVPDASYAIANMRVNPAGDFPGPACDSWKATPYDCLGPDAGGDGTCQVQLDPGNTFENIGNGRCFLSLTEALAG